MVVDVPVAVVVQVPLYMAVTCSVLVLPEVCRIMDFLGDWFDSGYMLLPVYVCLFGTVSTIFYEKGPLGS